MSILFWFFSNFSFICVSYTGLEIHPLFSYRGKPERQRASFHFIFSLDIIIYPRVPSQTRSPPKTSPCPHNSHVGGGGAAGMCWGMCPIFWSNIDIAIERLHAFLKNPRFAPVRSTDLCSVKFRNNTVIHYLRHRST